MASWPRLALVLASANPRASLGKVEECKHAVLKSRGYLVDPTTSKAIDEQVDALLEKWLVEEIPDDESPQFISPAFQVDKKDLEPGEKRNRRIVMGFQKLNPMLKPLVWAISRLC